MKPTSIEVIKAQYKGVYLGALSIADASIATCQDILKDNSLTKKERNIIFNIMAEAEQERIYALSALEEWD